MKCLFEVGAAMPRVKCFAWAMTLRGLAALLFAMLLYLPAAQAGVTLSGATPNTFSGPGQVITFHFRVDGENTIVNSVAVDMAYPVGPVTCTPDFPIRYFYSNRL
jgi:hypothetical protein